MRRLLTVLAALILAAPAASDEVRLGTDGAFPPFVSTAPDGTLEGYEPDLARALCAAAELTCTWVVLPFEELEPALMAGEIDAIMAALGVTPARQTRLAFTKPYDQPGGSYFAGLTKDADIRPGATIAATEGTLQAEYLEAGGYRLRAIPGGIDALLAALRRGEASALFSSTAPMEALLANGTLVLLSDVIATDSGMAIAVRPGDTALRARLDDGLAQIRGTGTLAAIRAKWF